ncbi:MAG: DNA primase TraC [Stenotrophomonas maltophilia]|nr:MAG: DNA primase TraC [Stenotrophomonas maltophilia]
MAAKNKSNARGSTATKYDDYAQLYANRVIAALQEGTAPWIRPWKAGVSRPPGEGMPYNAITGQGYSGANAMMLLMMQGANGYTDDRWLTFKQAADLGCHVRKGEKSTTCVKWIEAVEKEEETDPAQKKRMIPILFSVFNGNQVEGMAAAPVRQMPKEAKRHAQCDELLRDSGAIIRHDGGDRAFYSPHRDSIHLPPREAFKSTDNFYATALHELGHWTGHKSRLDRDLTGAFGSESYAKEELRAEMASMMIGERLGIGHDPGQHVAYIASWIKILKEHPREILLAAKDAEGIASHLGVAKFEHEPTKPLEKTAEIDSPPPALIVKQKSRGRGVELAR